MFANKYKNRFVNERIHNWERLEILLADLEKKPIRFLSKSELKELGELYRRAAVDLAVARADSQNPKLINYLNNLVIRAHGKIYRAESQGLTHLKNFFLKDLPETFRRRFGYFVFSALSFISFTSFSFILSYLDNDFSEVLGLETYRLYALNNFKWWLNINEANQIASVEILTNNIGVTLKAFAYGALFGIGTLYVLVFNALIIGGIFGVCYSANSTFGNELLAFVVAHGIIELSCIFIAGAAGLMIGHSIIAPGEYKRTDALKTAGLDATRLAVGVALFLTVAGFIEGFISPSSLPSVVKLSVGILSGIFMYSYLLLAGRKFPLETRRRFNRQQTGL